MPDVKEVYEMVTQQTGPRRGALERQFRKRDRKNRNRKIGALVVAAAIIAGILVFAIVPRQHEGSVITDHRSTVSPGSAELIGTQIVALDGTVLQRFPSVPAAARSVRFSPFGHDVGGRIAFMLDGRVGVTTEDGTDYQLFGSENTNLGDAQNAVSWSPNGLQIAYAANGQIYVMEADGSHVRRLTRSRPDGAYYPAWSPDGSTIAFWSGPRTGVDGGPAESEIFTVPAKGGTPTRLTFNDVTSIEPTWSPDGEQIAYMNGGELWVMGKDGSGQHRILRDKGSTWAPTWSPDGTKIAYLSCCVGNRTDIPSPQPLLDVRVLDLRTGKAQSLHVSVATDLNGPSWLESSDGLFVNRFG
jgi:tricorn protease-like protein